MGWKRSWLKGAVNPSCLCICVVSWCLLLAPPPPPPPPKSLEKQEGKCGICKHLWSSAAWVLSKPQQALIALWYPDRGYELWVGLRQLQWYVWSHLAPATSACPHASIIKHDSTQGMARQGQLALGPTCTCIYCYQGVGYCSGEIHQAPCLWLWWVYTESRMCQRRGAKGCILTNL